LAYSLILVLPTVVVLDTIVFLHDLTVDDAIWIVAGTMISIIAVVWLFLSDLTEMAHFTRQAPKAGRIGVPVLRSNVAREVVAAVSDLDDEWRERVNAFSRSLNADMQILEELTDPLILIDPAGRIIRANAAARILFRRDITDETIEQAFSAPELLQAVQTVLKHPEPISLAFKVVRRIVRYFEARIVSIEVPRGGGGGGGFMLPFAAVVVTIHETTELERAAELRDRFVADISHELRTPLTSIVGYIETLRESSDDPEVQQGFLKIMEGQAARMTRIVSDLLWLARIEQKEHTFPLELVALGKVIDEVVAALMPKARQRSLEISVFTESVPLVEGDMDQLFRLFQNLLDNAIKYSCEGGKIEVFYTQDDQTVTISIRDEGDGIAPEHLAHLGERFYRVDNARTRASGGSGLGLSIVDHILNRHNGKLKIESEVGKGSTFSVCFPIRGSRH
jgi:two-component system phosphate regulon sensor histidine kinase PhoR